jgi:hypothetical protein
MPEVILPCPACGSIDCECLFAEDEMYSVDCVDCSMRGPAERNPDSAIAAWNSLPRALTWTHEPPKVAGWYWWRISKGQNVNTIQIWSRSGVLGYCFDTEFITDLNRGEWAGPIAPPIE